MPPLTNHLHIPSLSCRKVGVVKISTIIMKAVLLHLRLCSKITGNFLCKHCISLKNKMDLIIFMYIYIILFNIQSQRGILWHGLGPESA